MPCGVGKPNMPLKPTTKLVSESLRKDSRARRCSSVSTKLVPPKIGSNGPRGGLPAPNPIIQLHQ
ncbi:MAG: hypothetical protein AB7G80_04800 [Dongiaceae bacterium]